MKKGDKFRLRPDGPVYEAYVVSPSAVGYIPTGKIFVYYVTHKDCIPEPNPIRVGDIVFKKGSLPELTYKVLEEVAGDQNVWIVRYPFFPTAVTQYFPKKDLELVKSA